jgi:hypothetical protein
VVQGGVGRCQVAPGGTRWCRTVEAVPGGGLMWVMIPSKHPSVLDHNIRLY